MKSIKFDSVAEALEVINEAKCFIEMQQDNLLQKNEALLRKEVRNLIQGVGKIIPEDYYAETRIQSGIPGVKNIRFFTDYRNGTKEVICKITSPVGKLLPRSIEVDGVIYPIYIIESKHYKEICDY